MRPTGAVVCLLPAPPIQLAHVTTVISFADANQLFSYECDLCKQRCREFLNAAKALRCQNELIGWLAVGVGA